MMALCFMQLREVVFGGVGSGLFSMIIFIMVTVFITSLMVGRSPEYLGKKIEPFVMKMASLFILLMPIIVLFLTALTVVLPSGIAAMKNPGPHGFTEVLYAFTSMGNNNGSSFAGLTVDTPFYNLLGGVEMLIMRFWLIIPVLAIAGTLAQQKKIPETIGTLPTHTPLFIILLLGVTFIFGALSFFGALALGPIVEQLMLGGYDGH
jgi:K+-transporting ATPase ATPase A chain